MKEIGGYFELELEKNKELYAKQLGLNSARNCLRYLIRVVGIKKIQIPAYTCPVIWESLLDESCEIVYYNINDEMLPVNELDKGEYVLYNNYFGLCSLQVKYMKEKYPKLIIDNAQAFFSDVETRYSFNSARKFFGVPDGGYLFLDKNYNLELQKDYSYDRIKHLVRRIDEGASKAYKYYQDNEENLDKEDIKTMSELTKRILSNIDYDRCKRVREENFRYLHTHLKDLNRFKIEDCSIPAMIYPFLPEDKYNARELKAKLIEDKIYIATYWQGQKDECYGKVLQDRLISLPIDQRYTTKDMSYIVDKIKAYISYIGDMNNE